MSVIANVMCTPNRLEMLVRAVAAEPDGISPDELLARLSPAVLRDEQGDEGGGVMARRVLQEAEALTLVERRANALYVRDESLADPARLQSWLHDQLLTISSAEALEQKAFPRALAWFLTLDPLQPVPTSSTDPSETAWARLRAAVGPDGDLFELGSQAPFMQFGYWARYLGYATHLRIPGGRAGFAPDPTDALARLIATRFRQGEELPIREFLDRISTYSPVLDSGSTRAALDAALSTDTVDRGVSRSLSYGLLCLDDTRAIRLQSRSDAPQLAVLVGDTRRSYTHVTIGGRNA